MNKTSMVFILLGLVILAGLGIYFFSAENNDDPSSPILETKIDYRSSEFTPVTIRAEEGQKVILKITSDLSDEVHFHGYDISKDITPGEQVIIEFTADKTGRFEIELEESGIEIGVIEVYPK